MLNVKQIKSKNWGKKLAYLDQRHEKKTYEGSCNFLLTKMNISDDETIHKFMYNLSFFQ